MTAWLVPVGKRLGGRAELLRRTPLAGGYAAGAVERADLRVGDREVAVVVKPADAVEVAALRAVAVVEGALVPRLLATDPLVLSWVDGAPAREGEPVPEAVLRTLGRVHRHWRVNRPRGIPVVDAAWWAALCARTAGSLGPYPEAARQVAAWAADERIRAALAVLPRTLCHGDPHRGNLLGDHVVDWGNARVAPAGLDLAVLEAQGPVDLAAYRAEHPELPGPLARVEREWARAHVHVQYLGFAADHLGPERVTHMVSVAVESLARLGRALRE